jgi:hypothetical protein
MDSVGLDLARGRAQLEVEQIHLREGAGFRLGKQTCAGRFLRTGCSPGFNSRNDYKYCYSGNANYYPDALLLLPESNISHDSTITGRK